MIATLIGLCITAKHIAIQVLVRRSTGIGDVTQATCRTVHGACLVSLQNRLCHIVFLCHIILFRCNLTNPFLWKTDQATGQLLSVHSAGQHGVAEAIPSSSRSFAMVDTMAGLLHQTPVSLPGAGWSCSNGDDDVCADSPC